MSSGTGWSRTSWTPTRGTTRPGPRRRRAACRPAGPGAMPAGTDDRGGYRQVAASGRRPVSSEIANEWGGAVSEAALAELSLLFVDEPAMTELHVRWMGEAGPTDVLAFPMDELRPPQPGGAHAEPSGSEPSGIPGLLGDVVICPQVAAAQARRARHSVTDEIDLLCTHGILHLLGYDHADAQEHAAMFGLQDRLLASWRADRGPDGGTANGRAAVGRDTAGRDTAGRDTAGHAADGRTAEHPRPPEPGPNAGAGGSGDDQATHG